MEHNASKIHLNNRFKVTQKPNTKANFFRDLKVGDILSVSVTLQGSRYALPVDVVNLRTGKSVNTTQGDFVNRIATLGLEAV